MKGTQMIACHHELSMTQTINLNNENCLTVTYTLSAS